MANTIIGIDLGTTNSAIAYLNHGHPQIIPNTDGATTTPSVVAFKNNTYQIGADAKRQMLVNQNVVLGIKRHMGDPNYRINVQGHSLTPAQVSAMILNYLRGCASQYLNQNITHAIITVPAYFNNRQRQDTAKAGQMAGLTVDRIINEPTAASLAYGVDRTQNQTILVYDLGGGTFDVSILQLNHGIFQVLSTNGDTHLGGRDFDDTLVYYVNDTFKKVHGVDLTKNVMAKQRLENACEQAKKYLSYHDKTTINIPFIAVSKNGPINLHFPLDRNTLQLLTAKLIDRTLPPMKKALADASLTFNDIDKIILNGGSTRMPAVRQAIKKWSGKEPSHDINPDEAVALGAAIQGGVINGSVNNVSLIDVTPMSLGVSMMGNKFDKIINRNTTIPVSKQDIVSTAADGQTTVNIHIYQGEQPDTRNDVKLADLQLSGIPKAPKGVPQIAVTFEIDKNGIVHVSAKDLASGMQKKITITNLNNQ